MKGFLVIIGIIVIIIEGYRILRGKWIRRMLGRGIEEKRERKPVVLKPKSERDCPHCVSEKGYYHLARYHESLAIKLREPIERKGKQQAQRYRRQTPAVAAGLVTRRWMVKEILSYPLL